MKLYEAIFYLSPELSPIHFVNYIVKTIRLSEKSQYNTIQYNTTQHWPTRETEELEIQQKQKSKQRSLTNRFNLNSQVIYIRIS